MSSLPVASASKPPLIGLPQRQKPLGVSLLKSLKNGFPIKTLTFSTASVTCGRRHGKSFLDVGAALVGCGHVSGLLMRQVWPLALMLCADRVPNNRAHFKEVR